MKKIISVLLSLILISGSVSLAASAGKSCSCGKTPIIMVSGFGATKLVKVNEDGSREIAFPFEGDAVIAAVKDNVSHFNPETPFLFIGDMVSQLLEPIRMNPDGTSYYDLEPIYSAASDTSLEAFKKNDAVDHIPYAGNVFLDMQCVADEVGEDHVFNFLYDWRMSGEDVADQLHDYIDDVLALTGHSQVSIYCLSQGSVCVSQYLYKYASEAKIENVVFDNPIMEGSDFVADIFGGEDGELELNFVDILNLLANILHTEIDLGAIGAILPDGLNFVAKFGIENYILPGVKDGAAYLEMLPDYKYEEICERYEFSSELLEKVDKVRNGYMKDVEGTLRTAEEYGACVSIVSCTGFDLFTGTKAPSDGIVNVSRSCGAYTSETPFEDGYVQQKDIGKNCISPDRTIDLSTGYMPEKTWIINELNHGQVEWAPVSLHLMEKLLYTHELTDAWSSYEFPQFIQSDDPSCDLCMRFTATNSLFGVCGKTGAVELKNVSNENSVCISRIDISGSKITQKATLPIVLEPGETVSFVIDTDKEAFGSMDVTYSAGDSIHKMKTRSFAFTVTDDYSGVAADAEIGSTDISFINRVFSIIWNIFSQMLSFILADIIK